ncbi:mercuric transport protein MerTP [Mangrovivirga sp. M17]|uniref:Mercuric transport protein MerT n=1 Tax=Mangrovivirga halotolerans TaxID=2993936 RepID=A0ABT3RVL3_9BACT|nr:mercuric transport protein MerTP [Mangrovivirga halotolerans]MCX2745404.1 mercuric transport protein MerTP [Mangrovivirga halotolerans]
MKSDNKIIGAGVLTAITASLCCITPVLALIAGTSGIASAFSWLEPFRPYLIGLTIFVLGFAWFQKLRPRTKEEIECACEDDEKPKFTQSKTFLGIVTVFAVVMLAFPYYADVFYPQNNNQEIVFEQADVKTVEFKVSGMTCAGCEAHVNNEVNKLEGIVTVNASYDNGNAIVKYDPSKTSSTEIEQAIKSTGYKVTNENQQQ